MLLVHSPWLSVAVLVVAHEVPVVGYYQVWPLVLSSLSMPCASIGPIQESTNQPREALGRHDSRLTGSYCIIVCAKRAFDCS